MYSEFYKELTDNRALWQKILGEKIYSKLLKNPEELEEKEVHQNKIDMLNKLFETELRNNTSESMRGNGLPFGEFFGFFGKIALRYSEAFEIPGLKNSKDTLLSNLYPELLWIAVRVLIQEIHRCKEEGGLKGNDTKEEYQDYQKRFLTNKNYIGKLCGSYPEMKRLIFKKIIYVTDEIQDILLKLKRDKKNIVESILGGKEFRKIEKLQFGLSDAHQNGETVAKVFLDNKNILVYKPRPLKKEKQFLDLYNHFCKKIGLSQQSLRTLDRGAYGWQACVMAYPCQGENEVQRYFERMGILLFLCYLLDVNDMHGENIIAAGEYPIPIDMETIPGYPEYKNSKNVEQMIYESIRHSVMSTGIVPTAVWSEDGKGVILNAINKGETVRTPFKIPVLCEVGSSEIHIEYRQENKKLLNSLPEIQANVVNPALYIKEISNGFWKSYFLFLSRKERYAPIFAKLYQGKSRYLFRHTQQYYMYLQSSYYPELLESSVRRRLFLHVLDKKTLFSELLSYERNALYQMNIPVFYFNGDENLLSDGNNKKYQNYRSTTTSCGWKYKLKTLGLQDLDRQIAFIEQSVGMLGEREYMNIKGIISTGNREKWGLKERAFKQADLVAAEICNKAYISDEDIGFCGTQIEESGYFRFSPVGMYLYNGLGGIVVFLAYILKQTPCEYYRYIYEKIVRKLFNYTKNVAHKMASPESTHTGAFDGEGSIVYTYFLLYQLTKEERFLEYAEFHALIVKDLWYAEISMDFLSGLSGAVFVFCCMYQVTRKRKYIDFAADMAETVWEKCERTEKSAGWCMKSGVPPLAGLAHGNSGLMLAYGCLLEHIKDPKYIDRIKKLLAYENSLYDSGNWKDLRNPDGLRLCNNAWCHGAAGILMSREKLKQAGYPDKDNIVKRDIERCRRIFLEKKEPEDLCLCHGIAGNYLVLSRYLQNESDEELEQEKKNIFERLLKKLEDKQVPVYEKHNLALMSGMSGIGLILCMESGF